MHPRGRKVLLSLSKPATPVPFRSARLVAPEIPVDVNVCIVGRINAGVREGAGPWQTCPDDACTEQKLRDLLAAAGAYYAGFVRFNFVGYKRIQDPVPPGNQRCPSNYYGDVCIEPGFGADPGREPSQMVSDCFAAWGLPAPFEDSCKRSVTLVLARGSVVNQTCGVGAPAYGPDRAPDSCADPNTIPDNTAGAFAFLGTVNGFGLVNCNLIPTTAHELGHALGLQHGDGLDNNCNLVWDENCDRNPSFPAATDEIDTGPDTLMGPTGPDAPLTILQTDRARIFATKSVPTFASVGTNCVAPPLPNPPGDSAAAAPPPSASCGCAAGRAGRSAESLLGLGIGLVLLLTRRRVKGGD
jgi:hypothetical protein